MRIYADPAALVITWLREAVADEQALESGVSECWDGLAISNRVPPTRDADSDPLLVVRRSGGLAGSLVQDRPRLDFMSWGKTEYLATALANKIRALCLHDLKGSVIQGHTIYRVSEFAGPLPYPDPAGSAVPIVMFTLEIPVRVN